MTVLGKLLLLRGIPVRTLGLCFVSKMLSASSSFANLQIAHHNHTKTGDTSKKVLVGVCQMNATSIKADNLQTIIELVAAAAARGAQVCIVLLHDLRKLLDV